MKLLRNAEVMTALAVQAILTFICCVFFQVYAGIGLHIFAVCAAYIVIYLVSTRRRYLKIAALAGDIDKILHGGDVLPIDNCTEGELGILQSEIYKMTVRLREQQQNLKKDKTYLADSIADISHQIRTPLTTINLIVTRLMRGDITDEKRLELTRELYGLLSRIDSLITILLKISKLDAGTVVFESERHELSSLIDTSSSPLLVPIELRCQELKITASGYFDGDFSWTCEALSNIIKNCMEHTPTGGTISVDACENPLYSEIIVTDTGNGISKKDLPHIFERFYKGENSGEGSFGIGLALARMIVTGQGGTLKAENLPHSGAKFTMRIYKGTV